jgi:hypothetical protein
LLPTLLGLSSCIYLRTTSQSFETSTPAPEVGGAKFRAEFIPRGSEAGVTVSAMVVGGAMITENGPYQLRLHAFGKKGEQRWFRVTRFVLTVPGRLEAPMEKRAFEGSTPFENLSASGSTRASLLFGTKIHINTADHRDEEIYVEADVEVMRRGSLVRGTIRLPMQRTKSSRGKSHFIPAEIVKSFRQETPASIPSALPPPPEAPLPPRGQFFSL